MYKIISNTKGKRPYQAKTMRGRQRRKTEHILHVNCHIASESDGMKSNDIVEKRKRIGHDTDTGCFVNRMALCCVCVSASAVDVYGYVVTAAIREISSCCAAA